MKKSMKRITAVVVAALAAISLVFLVACGSPAAETEYYTVTVQYEDGTAVDGTTQGTMSSKVYVQLCDSADVEGSCYQLLEVGTDGKVSVEKSLVDTALDNPASLVVHIQGMPLGYYMSEEVFLNATTTSATVTLRVLPTFTLDERRTLEVGVLAQFTSATGGDFVMTMTTDTGFENGSARALFDSVAEYDKYVAFQAYDALIEYDYSGDAVYSFTLEAGGTQDFVLYDEDGKTFLTITEAAAPAASKTTLTIDNTDATTITVGTDPLTMTTSASTASVYLVTVTMLTTVANQVSTLNISFGESTIPLVEYVSSMPSTTKTYTALLNLAAGSNDFTVQLTGSAGSTDGLPFTIKIDSTSNNALTSGENTVNHETLYYFTGVGSYTVTISMPSGSTATADLYTSMAAYNEVVSVADTSMHATYSFTLVAGQGATFIVYVSDEESSAILTIAEAGEEPAEPAIPVLNIDGAAATLTQTTDSATDPATTTPATATLNLTTPANYYLTATITGVPTETDIRRIGITNAEAGVRIMGSLNYDEPTQTCTGVLALSALPAGEYTLNFAVLDGQNELIAANLTITVTITSTPPTVS